jgi:DNA modification methylase
MTGLEPVDLVFTDPPYGVSFKKPGKPYMVGDCANLLPAFLPIVYNIIKDDGAIYLFSSLQNLYQFWTIFQMYFKIHNIIIWDKINPIYPHSKAHYSMQYEPIFYGSKGLHYLKNKKIGDIVQAKIPRGGKRQHPTQKPVGVIKKILESTQESKNIILDPFLGSGTTAIACERLNRQWIGIEISEEYCEIAAKRIESERAQLKMF